jgi:hypothetical protein
MLIIRLYAAELFFSFLQYETRDDEICFNCRPEARLREKELQRASGPYRNANVSGTQVVASRTAASHLPCLQRPSWEFMERSSGRPDIGKRIEQTSSAQGTISGSRKKVIDLSMSILSSKKYIYWLSNS